MWPFKRKPVSLSPPVAQGNFTLQASLAGQSGRQIAIQAYIFDGESKESLDERIDLLQEVIERQRTRCEIPELEARRDQMVKGLEQARDVLTDLETRHKNGERLSSQELVNINNMRVNIKKVNEELDKGEKAIQEAKKKSGVG